MAKKHYVWLLGEKSLVIGEHSLAKLGIIDRVIFDVFWRYAPLLLCKSV